MIELKQHLSNIDHLERQRLTDCDRNLSSSDSVGASHQLKDVFEARIGGQLFPRKTRPVKFTSEGEICLSRRWDTTTNRQSRERTREPKRMRVNGRLHTAIECHSCFQWLMPALKEYQVAWPSVTLDFYSVRLWFLNLYQLWWLGNWLGDHLWHSAAFRGPLRTASWFWNV